MILSANNIAAKVNEAFDEFRKKFNPTLLHEAMIDLAAMAARSVQFCPGITELVGSEESSLEATVITNIPVGTTILVPFGGSLLQYTLVSNQLVTVAPYVVRSAFSTTEQPRAWVRTGAKYGTFVHADLDEEALLKVTHGFGFPFCNVLVFDNNNIYRPGTTFSPDAEDPNNKVVISIGQGFEGTWKLLITY